MSNFNLVKDPWIAVITQNSGERKEVSLVELFSNAHNYARIAGETPSQDFSTLRFLLAIMHTVFSRFDGEGNKYGFVEIDEKYKLTVSIDEDDEEEYFQKLFETWEKLWNQDKFPEIVEEYLLKWEDRFDLYGKEYPFYQLSKDDFKKLKVEKTGSINFRLVNRLISESNNKVEIFSPSNEKFKNSLSNAELARWIIAFQGFTGTGDKAKFPGMKESASKGWLLGLGGVYLSGKTIKETLLLNMSLERKSLSETPIWEKELSEKIEGLRKQQPENLSELYTNWSRLLLIDEDEKDKSTTVLKAVQLPGINPQEFFLEQMTLWKYSTSGNDKDHFIPRTHNVNQSFWRSFGSLNLREINGEKNIKPGIIDWHNTLVEKGYISGKTVSVNAIGMSYNRDASTMPNNEITDSLNIYNEILTDVADNGWINVISTEINNVKSSIEFIFKNFIKDIELIRNLRDGVLTENLLEEAYYNIDTPFRDWISDIKVEDEKEPKVVLWRKTLTGILKNMAKDILDGASNRDYLGTTVKRDKKSSTEEYLNIIIAYNRFIWNLNTIQTK